MILFRLNPSSGVPIYLQLMEQIKHAIETGALKAGDQLPTIRKLSEDLVMNPNTVVRAYHELQHEGIIELKHGSGAFISESVAGQSEGHAKGSDNCAVGPGTPHVPRSYQRRGEKAL